MNSSRVLTTTELLAAATSELTNGGYSRIDTDSLKEWSYTTGRLFEDSFGVVAVVVFETWQDLTREWTETQAVLVNLISARMARSEPKAWDGYLVLLTPGVRGKRGLREWTSIIRNTSRLRKLVASGEDLRSLSDVRTLLLPLLAIKSEEMNLEQSESVFEILPEILRTSSRINPQATETLVSAFREQRNMMQALHEFRVEKL